MQKGYFMSITRICFLIVLAFGFSTRALTQCSGSMKVINPADGATVNSHFQVDAAASSSCSISAVHLYIDNHLQFVQYKQAALSGKFNAKPGTHNVVVQAWASDGKVFNKSVRITVSQVVASSCTTTFDPNVAVCGPGNLTESKGSVLLHASARSTANPVISLKAYANGVLKTASYDENAGEMEAVIALPRGLQNLNVVAKSSNGNEFHNETNVQVISAATTCQAPFVSSLLPTPGDAPEFMPAFAAADAAACSVTALNVYVDGKLFYAQTSQKLLEGRLTMQPGLHNVVFQAWNSQGAISKKAININVVGDFEPTCVPNADPGISICQGEPAGNGYMNIMVGTPVTPASPFTAARIYVDGVSRATFYNFAAKGSLTFLQMKRGTHKVTAVGWTQKGDVVSDTQTVTVP
jgi:hypothetical protein